MSEDRKFYISHVGFDRLQAELHHLVKIERPEMVEKVAWAASNGDRSENGDYIYGKRKLREIDRRIRFLTLRLEKSTRVDPCVHYGKDQIFFGATVTYSDADGQEFRVTILGEDEADALAQQITWLSPVARALLKARVGDSVRLITPSGPQLLDIIAVEYPAPLST